MLSIRKRRNRNSDSKATAVGCCFFRGEMGKCRREGSRRDWISDFIFTSLLARHGTFFLHDDHRGKRGVVLSYPTALRSPDPGLLSSKNDSYKKDATMTHGTLIVLEGIDGSGKATQSNPFGKETKKKLGRMSCIFPSLIMRATRRLW